MNLSIEETKVLMEAVTELNEYLVEKPNMIPYQESLNKKLTEAKTIKKKVVKK